MSERIREIKERFEFNLKLAESTGGATGAEYKDIPYLLDLVDSLQQQLESSVTRIGELKRQARRSDSELDGAIKEVVNLREQLAERDRTIDLLTKQITDEVGISAKAIAERDLFKGSFEHWNKEAHRVVDENSKLRKALEDTQKALQWGDPENAISQVLNVIDHALKPKKWTVVNTVYFNDDSNQIYGYKVKNEDNTMRRIISSKTANELTLKGELIFSPRQELSFVSVDRDYIEKALGE